MDKTIENQKGIQTSAGKSGITSEDSKTFTREEAQALVNKAKSDAFAEIGRHKKAAEEAIKQMQAIEERLSKMQEDRFETELEVAKDDPDKLREIRQRQRDIKERLSTEAEKRKWANEKAAYDERIKRAEAIERRDLAREVADEFKVDYKTLEKFGSDRESMLELAKSLPKSGDTQGGQGSRAMEPPEGGKTKGGGLGRTPTTEELGASTPFETAAKIKSGEWIVRGWTP